MVSGAIKWSVEKVKKTYAEKNIDFLSDVYDGCNVYYDVQCKECKHIWKTHLVHFRHENDKCPKCCGSDKHSIKYNLDDVRKICLESNVEFLDGYYLPKQRQPLKCLKCNYVWTPLFYTFKSNSGGNDGSGYSKCPKCLGVASQTYLELKELAESKNLEFYCANYKNQKSECQLKCKTCGYINTTSCRSIIKRHGCTKCQKKLKYTIEDVRAKCESLSLVFLESSYKNSFTNYNFQCKICNRVFERTYNSLKGCPRCSCGLREEIVRLIAEEFAGEESTKIRPKFLLYLNKRPLELDIYFDSLKLAIEHDGSQHHKLCVFNNFDEALLEKQKQRDHFKNLKCKEQNINLIRIPEVFTSIKPNDLIDKLKTVFNDYNLGQDVIINFPNILTKALANTTKKNNPRISKLPKSPPTVKKRKKRKLKAYCLYGHEMIGDNVVYKKRGERIGPACRTCRMEADKIRRLKLKDKRNGI